MKYICKSCKTKFNPKLPDKRFCSGSCRYKFYKGLNIVRCKECGKEFSNYHHKSQEYCSSMCSGRKHSARMKGRKLSIITRKKISEAHKNNPFWLGKKFSKTHIKNLKNSHIKSEHKKNTNGYFLIYSPDHPFCTKSNYVLEHRLVMEKHLGRYLEPQEVVHHINEIKTDNRIENLRLFKDRSTHISHHKNLK